MKLGLVIHYAPRFMRTSSTTTAALVNGEINIDEWVRGYLLAALTMDRAALHWTRRWFLRIGGSIFDAESERFLMRMFRW
jgi:hypothetical protein